LSDIKERLDGNCVGFTDLIVWKDKILPTITANGKIFNANDKTHVSDKELIFGQTFPTDYNFSTENVRYICGMSVPPIMIKRIVNRLIESGLFDYKIKENKND
jgi:DNA (cytosine-5)-methyltransferase 1